MQPAPHLPVHHVCVDQLVQLVVQLYAQVLLGGDNLSLLATDVHRQMRCMVPSPLVWTAAAAGDLGNSRR